MTIRCPKCKTPSLLSPEEVGEVGRLERCPNCQTTWLARHFAANADFGRRDRRPMTRRESPIIDGEFVPPIRFTSGFHGQGAARTASVRVPPAARRYGFVAAATALVLTLIAIVLLTPAVSALPRFVGFVTERGSVALEAVSSKTVTLRGTEAILVEGQIVNRSGQDLDVPAVRIALKEDGSEVYSWLMEPTVQRVRAGETVGFRSAMASPRPGASQIALSLADRGDAGTGAR
ncbi:zinc-ribbon domain-containing protein [Bauldia litoralis]|uniref:MJ0042 family finger-like domain-containing protein n=1 Tax=Bauldia litoralis TaxID=665467 RepID=A0A1G6BZ78_9HYPH|nr:zinc-ribbon domain-containing protein [Bauldia litoralis]SDB25914.1 MJ0042 family finger-like domain-containing protein [Bauldia litoralis]